jgi:hypothetical protein
VRCARISWFGRSHPIAAAVAAAYTFKVHRGGLIALIESLDLHRPS